VNTDPEYFDIGPERPTQPPEPDITDTALDALRASWLAEARAWVQDGSWWTLEIHTSAWNRAALVSIAALVARGELGAAQYQVERVVEREVELMEREYFNG